MKTSFSSKSLISVLFFFINGGLLFAQTTCDNWPPNQAFKATEVIFSCCSGFIEIDRSQLTTFLLKEEQLYSSEVNSPCPYPTNLPGSGRFSFGWENIPGAHLYQIRYLNLRTGAGGQEQTDSNEFRLPFLNPNRDHYLFLFATIISSEEDEIKKSGNHIIIDEKLIYQTDSIAKPKTN